MFKNDILKLLLAKGKKEGRLSHLEKMGIDLESYADYNDTDIFDYEYQIVKEEETEPKYRSMKNTKPKDMQNVVEGKTASILRGWFVQRGYIFSQYLDLMVMVLPIVGEMHQLQGIVMCK